MHHGHKAPYGYGVHNQQMKPGPAWEKFPQTGGLSLERSLAIPPIATQETLGSLMFHCGWQVTHSLALCSGVSFQECLDRAWP